MSRDSASPRRQPDDRSPAFAFFGGLAETELAAPERLVARSLGIPFVDLETYLISPGILRRLPTRVEIRERCVPMVHNSRRTVLVVDDPARIPWLSARRDELGLSPADRVEFALTTARGIDRALARRLEGPE